MSAGTSTAERAVRRQRHRAQFGDLAAGMDDVGVRRARGQALAGQHADRPHVRPAGRGVLREPGVLAEQEARRPDLVGLLPDRPSPPTAAVADAGPERPANAAAPRPNHTGASAAPACSADPRSRSSRSCSRTPSAFSFFTVTSYGMIRGRVHSRRPSGRAATSPASMRMCC